MHYGIKSYRILGGANIGDLTPDIGNNVLLLLLYALFGIGFPLVVMWGLRKIFTKKISLLFHKGT